MKSKNRESKECKRVKIVKEVKNKVEFQDYFINEATKFTEHAERVSSQYQAQGNLEESLPSNHVYIHMDFEEDYRCRSRDEIQSAYWSPTQVTIHSVVTYYKVYNKLKHQSYVFISNETRHDAKFVFALITTFLPKLKEFRTQLEYVHYWTDSPTSQYRNKTIFKIISCHASWNYMEAGHGKGPCDPTGGTAKRKADQAVKNGKYIIQDAHDFYQWAITSNDSSAIKFLFLSTSDYEKSASS